ncbi:MAG: sulfotransferase [Gammaproteobacteria bacterium]|nr:sulfotransferase [Gammaproteobacteria bacterium]
MKTGRVVYIMGSGRSGSTVLEVLLANSPDAVGVGELSHVIEDGFIKNKKCSCGEEFRKCGFWGRIVARVESERRDWERLNRILRGVEWHKGYWLTLLGLQKKKVQCDYKEINEVLLDAIFEEGEGKYIIDSSKYAGRALALSQQRDIRVICLLRSPSGLLNSFRKPNKEEQRPKSLVSLFLYYVYVTTSVRLAISRLPTQVFKLNYEDLVKNPSRVLDEISEFTELNLVDVKRKVEEKRMHTVGHLITANRIRKSQYVTLNTKIEVKDRHTLIEKVLIFVMQMWAKLLRL